MAKIGNIDTVMDLVLELEEDRQVTSERYIYNAETEEYDMAARGNIDNVRAPARPGWSGSGWVITEPSVYTETEKYDGPVPACGSPGTGRHMKCDQPVIDYGRLNPDGSPHKCGTASTMTEEAKTINNKAAAVLGGEAVTVSESEIDDIAHAIAGVCKYESLYWHVTHAESTMAEKVFLTAMLEKVTEGMEYFSPGEGQVYGSYVRDDTDPCKKAKPERSYEGLKDMATLFIIGLAFWGFVAAIILAVTGRI
jgi:hypothetical protein